MRILITGANGQLGSEVADSFARQHQIFALVRELPKRASENVRYLQHDLTRSPETLISKIEALDAIIHIAQSRHYKDFPDQADDIFNVNVKSTQDLLSLGKLLKIKYFLYTSTGSVYEPFDNNLSEECPVKPLTFYSTSKYISEKIISCYSSCFDVCIFRLFFLYGRPSASSLISALVKRIRLRESITIEGTDGLVFTPTHVSDVANLIERALTDRWQGTINVASPEFISLKELVAKISNHMRIEPNLNYLPDKMPPTIIPSLDKLRSVYQNMSFLSINQGLERYLKGESYSR